MRVSDAVRPQARVSAAQLAAAVLLATDPGSRALQVAGTALAELRAAGFADANGLREPLTSLIVPVAAPVARLDVDALWPTGGRGRRWIAARFWLGEEAATLGAARSDDAYLLSRLEPSEVVGALFAATGLDRATDADPGGRPLELDLAELDDGHGLGWRFTAHVSGAPPPLEAVEGAAGLHRITLLDGDRVRLDPVTAAELRDEVLRRAGLAAA